MLYPGSVRLLGYFTQHNTCLREEKRDREKERDKVLFYIWYHIGFTSNNVFCCFAFVADKCNAYWNSFKTSFFTSYHNQTERYLLILKKHSRAHIKKNNVLREWLELTDWRNKDEEAEHDKRAISFGYRYKPLSP